MRTGHAGPRSFLQRATARTTERLLLVDITFACLLAGPQGRNLGHRSCGQCDLQVLSVSRLPVVGRMYRRGVPLFRRDGRVIYHKSSVSLPITCRGLRPTRSTGKLALLLTWGETIRRPHGVSDPSTNGIEYTWMSAANANNNTRRHPIT